MKNPEFVQEYEALEEEFSLASALISARSQVNMTQENVAARMGTSQSYIAKLGGGTVSPTRKALKRYAAATGSRPRSCLSHLHCNRPYQPKFRTFLL